MASNNAVKTWTIQAVRVHSPAEGHLELVELIHGNGQMIVSQLSSDFGVSGDTVRQDLELSRIKDYW